MKVIVFLIVVVGLALLAGFVWMIGLGVLSHIFHAKNLAISFKQSVVVAFIANLLIGGLRGSKS